MKPRTKVALPAFCAMGFSLSLFLTIGALYAKQQVQRQVARQIPGNGRICAQAVNEVFTTQEEDLEALSTVPANTGIAGCCSSGSRTEAPGGVSLEHWCLQFEQDLASRITNGTGCTQEGFLLTSSSWTGLVRVDARKGAARAVPAYTLQARSGEPGFQNIAQRAGGSIICISRLPPDREHGKVSGPPAIRAVHPAQNTAGGVCGANAAGTSDVALLTHTRPKITPDYSVNAISEKQAGNCGSAAAPAIQLHSRPLG
mgnify:FL=1